MDEKQGLLSRLRRGLSRTRAAWAGRLERVLAESGPSDDDWDELEESLLAADFGVQATQRLLDSVRGSVRPGNGAGDALLREELGNLLREHGGLGEERYSASPW